MSGKSKSSSRGKLLKLPVDRPFEAGLLRRARQVAEQYTVLLQPDTDLGFVARGLELPMVMDDGRTPDECVRKTREAFVVAVATILEAGEIPPAAATENRRSEQINIRVNSEEKLLIEEAARNRGYRGVSDFVRSATLASIRRAG